MDVANFVISIILSFFGLITSIIAIIISERNAKRIEKRDDCRHLEQVRIDAISFIQKYNCDDEIQLIGLAIIADNYDKMFPYKRAFYKDWLLLTDEVKKKVLDELDFDGDILFYNKSFFDDDMSYLKSIIEEFYLDPNFYNETFYDGQKYLRRSLERYNKEKPVDEIIGYKLSNLLGKNPCKFKDVITDILAKCNADIELNSGETFNTKSMKILDCKRIDNGNYGNFKSGDERVACYLCNLVTRFVPIYYSKNNCALERYGYIEDFAFTNDWYMEDDFLFSLFCLHFYRRKKEDSIND